MSDETLELVHFNDKPPEPYRTVREIVAAYFSGPDTDAHDFLMEIKDTLYLEDTVKGTKERLEECDRKIEQGFAALTAYNNKKELDAAVSGAQAIMDKPQGARLEPIDDPEVALVSLSKQIKRLMDQNSALKNNIRRLLDQVGDKRQCKGPNCLREIWYINLKTGRVGIYTEEALSHFADCPDADMFRGKERD